ncbi:hypothetical protein HMPREF1868_00306 [Olsenella sp. DNF00959]|nr:hypothetical protein HMPREF1868_00306 [Olsenella sp. DNF00959]
MDVVAMYPDALGAFAATNGPAIVSTTPSTRQSASTTSNARQPLTSTSNACRFVPTTSDASYR